MFNHDFLRIDYFLPKMIPFLITLFLANLFSSNWINCQEAETALGINEGLDDTIEEPMAITSNYKELIARSRIFVDKSLLIKEILEDTSKVTLLVCPRKWGKTLNLDMIKTFLEIQVDENGKKMAELRETENYKLFRRGEIILANGSTAKLRNRPLVGKFTSLFKPYFGKHSVIFLDLGGLKKNSHEAFVEEFRKKIGQMYRPFRYILKATDNENAASEENENVSFDRSKFKRYLRRKSTEEELLDSVIFLSKVLEAYFKVGVFVLIDEYLTLLYEILLDTNYPDAETTLQFHQNFVNVTLRCNPHMIKGILTGILRQNSETHFDAGFMRERCFFDDSIFNFYGFRRKETDMLCEYFSFKSKKMNRIERWYGGYRAGSNSNLKISNPWSVAHYINSRDFQVYWRDKNTIEPLIKKLLLIPSFDNAICALITKNSYTIDEFRNLKYTLLDFESINQAIRNFVQNKEISLLSTADVVFKFFCMYGYLSLNNTYSKTNQYNVAMQVPSYELQSSISVQVSNYHLTVLGLEITPDNLALFENLRVALKMSTTDNKIVCTELEASVESLLNIIPAFTRITRLNDVNENIIRANENVLISLFKYALINGDPSFNFIASDQSRDLLLMYRRHGIVLQVKPNVNAIMATGEEKEAYSKFFRNRGMTSYKLVQVFVTYKNKVRTIASVFNEQMLRRN